MADRLIGELAGFDELAPDGEGQGELGRGRRPPPRPRPAPPRRRARPAPARALPARLVRPFAHRGGCSCAACALARRGGHRLNYDCARCAGWRSRPARPVLVEPLAAWPDASPAAAPPEGGREHARWVQSTLNRILGLRLPVDGIIGPETRSAVRSFQRSKGLPEDGIVGPPTERALIGASSGGPAVAGPPPPAEPASAPAESELFGEVWEGELDRGDSDYVRWVQASLNRIMGTRLAVDGAAGPRTREAVKGFQRRAGLRADGVVGPRTEAAIIAAGVGQPPGGGAAPRPLPPVPPPAPRPAGAPRLLKREDAPPAATLYTEIDLNIVDKAGNRVARPVTGIFLPEWYAPGPAVDLILYLHGHKGRADLAIDSYWDRRQTPPFALREATNESRRNLVLVAPTLGPRSEAGSLVRPGGLDAYLERVLVALGAHGPHGGSLPRLGSLVLACHSGGGYPMRKAALGRDRAVAAIRECWGFDCTYNGGDDTLWAEWARARPGARLYVYYIPDTQTARLALSLQRQGGPNVTVAASRARGGHNWVPLAHWRERVEGAPFLRAG